MYGSNLKMVIFQPAMLVYQRVFFVHFPANLFFCGGKTFELELGRGFVLKNLSQPTHSLKLTAILPRKGNLMFQSFFRGELLISGVQVGFLLLETNSNLKEFWEPLAHGHASLSTCPRHTIHPRSGGMSLFAWCRMVPVFLSTCIGLWPIRVVRMWGHVRLQNLSMLGHIGCNVGSTMVFLSQIGLHGLDWSR